MTMNDLDENRQTDFPSHLPCVLNLGLLLLNLKGAGAKISSRAIRAVRAVRAVSR